MVAPESDSFVGICLGDTYRVVRRLGAGGMGVVYEAEHTRLPRSFAVKVLRRDRLAARAVEQFRREAENACRLHHRHIVDVFDYNLTPEGTPYLVMELLTGDDLAGRLAARRRLSLTEVQLVLRQTTSAITAAHEAGLVHSDLKPSNLFLCQRGTAEDYVKVLDFGIARVAYARDALGQGVMAGTPWYMAPEQLSSLGIVDQRADVWALAVISYQMLTGRLPFEGAVPEVLRQIVGEEPPPLERFNRQLGPGLDPVFRRALAKRPSARYPTARAFLTDFVAAIKRSAAHADWVDLKTPTGSWLVEAATRNDIISADTISNPPEVVAAPAFAASLPVRRELRRAERAPGRLAVYQDGFLGSTVDVSASGALIQTHRGIAPGTRLELTLAIPGSLGLQVVSARAVRQELSKAAGTNVAVEFEGRSDAARAALEWYVAWLREGRAFGWRVLTESGHPVVPLFGSLTENADLDTLLASLLELPPPVVLNLRDLRRMNSVAVGNWIRFSMALAKRYPVILEECSVPFLETALLVPNVIFRARVSSCYLPSHCPGCGEEEGHLIQLATDLSPAGTLAPDLGERTRCFNCDGQVVFDELCQSLLQVVAESLR